MRNLKRALSLALALVMVMSLTIVGAGAVSTDDFSDGADIVNKEAVTVLATLGVITGNDDGSYAPADTISRAEMSTIICRVLNGGKDPVLGESVTNSYTDTASHWAKNYIEYCSTLGIVAGKGDGTFDPEGDVTVAEAAKMVLVALGYNAPIEGYVGGAWQINVDARANPIGLYDDLDYTTTSAALTRDNAAQMLYNALDCDMVRYDVVLDTTSSTVINTTQRYSTEESLLENKFNAVKVEGVIIANEVANLEASANGNGSSLEDGRTKIDIDEEADQDYYTGTKTFSVSSTMDELGRYVAIYVKKDRNPVNAQVLGSVIVSEDNKVVTDASSDDIQTVIDDNDLNRTANTLVAKNYQGLTALTDGQATADGTNGVQKIIIDNDDDGDVDYVLLNTYYFGKVTTYVSSGDGSIAISVGNTQTTESFFNKTVTRLAADDMDDVVGFEDVAKGDYVNAQFIGGDLHVSLAESVTGVLDSYKFDDDGNLITKVTVDGNDYNVSNVTGYTGGDDDIRKPADEANDFVTSEITLFLDNNGYAVALGDAEANAGKYAMVLAVGQNIEDRVKVILADGTVGTYTINDDGANAVEKDDLSIGEVYRYSINSDDEIKLMDYDLERGVDANGDPDSSVPGYTEEANAKFEKGKITIESDGGTDYANTSTVFFYVNDADGKIITTYAGNEEHSIDHKDVDTYASYTTAPDLSTGATATVYKRVTDDNERVVAVVFAGTNLAEADVSDNLYIASIIGADGDQTEVTAYVNGSEDPQTITIDDEISVIGGYRRTTWTYSVNADGTYALDTRYPDTYTVTDVVGNNFVAKDSAGSEETYAITADTLVVDDSKYLDSIVATLGTDATVSEGDHIIGLIDDDNDALMVVIRNEKPTSSAGVETGADSVENGNATLSKDDSLTDVAPKSIQVASTTGNIKFTFEVTGSAGKTVNYDYAVYLNGDWQADVEGGSATADSKNVVTVSDNTTLNGYYTSGDEVEVVITAAAVKPYAQEDLDGTDVDAINDALANAELYGEPEVLVEGSMAPGEELVIPEGVKLVVEGDFTDTEGFTGDLEVQGEYKADGAAANITGTLTTQTIASDSEALNVTGTLNVTEDATLPDDSAIEGTVTVADGKTLSAAASSEITLNGATIEGAVDLSSATTVNLNGENTLSSGSLKVTKTSLAANEGDSITVVEGAEVTLGSDKLTDVVTDGGFTIRANAGGGVDYVFTEDVTVATALTVASKDTLVIGADVTVTVATGSDIAGSGTVNAEKGAVIVSNGTLTNSSLTAINAAGTWTYGESGWTTGA